MKSIFEEESYFALVSRLDKLTNESESQWGKMNVQQMLVHCRKSIELAMGDINVQARNPLVKFFAGFFKASLYNDKPFRKNLKTLNELVIKDHGSFEVEHRKLKRLMHRMHTAEKFFFPYTAHPIFGRLEPDMWGQLIYKHLDHHFKQFGV